jgi:hypothetical protein
MILYQPQRLDNVKPDRLLHFPSIYVTPLRKAKNYLCFEAKKHTVMDGDWCLIGYVCQSQGSMQQPVQNLLHSQVLFQKYQHQH